MNKMLFCCLMIVWILIFSGCSPQQAGPSKPISVPTNTPAVLAETATATIQAATKTPLPPTFTPLPTDTPLPTATAADIMTPTPAPTATPENLVFRDDFSGALQPGWTWENEVADRRIFTQDGWLRILAGDNALLYGEKQSNLLWRDLPSGDFVITTHINTTPYANFHQATIYLYEDKNNFVAINRGFCGPCVPGGNGVYMEYKIGGGSGAYKQAIKETDVYLRLESKKNVITGYYAVAPDQWQRLGRFGNYFIFKRVGLGATNADSKASINANLIALFDYFEITKP